MKIAVTYENGEVFQHFGHTPAFKVYEVEGTEIVFSEVVGTGDSGHELLAGFLGTRSISTLICGGIGMGAVNALSSCGIKVVPGAAGDADAAVKAFLEGRLVVNATPNCNHHHEGGDGGCGHCHH